ncbi:hypothetical protein KHC28_01370 [Ancylobacter sonchi]|uniref:hypothetical protein n=1 Tax=Ancylobacter sonchi TaxID=1937790 RepID=UPI001BD24BA9|nr:hypothetical protein [Ancylobacter sonchi]MBS7532302.1 hypothetical protein [Ancylobacter sonchi]
MTVDRLRHDIDSGKTRDKVAFPDPAAAPLGTDDEAAGTPASPERIAYAEQQIERSKGDAPGAPDERSRRYDGVLHQTAGFPLVGVVSALAAAAGVVIAVLLWI